MVLEEKIVELKPWEAHEFFWGVAVKKKNGEWTTIFINGQEINVEGVPIILHENGIEFVK